MSASAAFESMAPSVSNFHKRASRRGNEPVATPVSCGLPRNIGQECGAVADFGRGVERAVSPCNLAGRMATTISAVSRKTALFLALLLDKEEMGEVLLSSQNPPLSLLGKGRRKRHGLSSNGFGEPIQRDMITATFQPSGPCD